MTQAEKMAQVRAEVVAALAIPENAVQVDTATYAIPTENGWAKIAVSAVKGDYDAEQAHADWVQERTEAEAKAAQRKADAEAKKATKGK